MNIRQVIIIRFAYNGRSDLGGELYKMGIGRMDKVGYTSRILYI